MRPKTKRLILVRHGQADTRGVFLGHLDYPLTEQGHEQAQAVAKRLGHFDLDLLVTSPLQRAYQTAEYLQPLCQKPLICDARLIEQDFGLWDGLLFAEVMNRFPEDYQKWSGGDPKFTPSQGESLLSVELRLKAALDDYLPQIKEGGAMVWAAHCGAIQTILCHLLKVPLSNRWPFFLSTATYAELEFYDFGVRMVRFGG